MTERSVYHDFARAMFDRFKSEINGKIIYEIYPEIDTVIFKISFKDFEYSYAVNNVTHIIYGGNQDLLVEEFLKKYRKSILSAFFKTEAHKRRDEMRMVAQ